MTRKPNFLDHEELASIHKLHREGKLDKAAKILLREELIPASVWQRVIESASITQQIGQQLAEINRINFSIDFSHIYATLNNIDTSSMRRAFNVSSEVVKLMQSLDVWQESYFQEIVKITDSLNEVTRRVSADLAAFQLAFQDIISSDIISDLIKLWEETEDAKEAFREAGWPITPSMTKQVKDRVVELHKQGKTGYASQVILGYYRRKNYQNLKLAIESWENHSLFKPRMHIIQDAFEAHCSGLYTLSVPALLPLVEGILNDYVSTNNLSAKFGKIARVYEAVIGDPREYDLSKWAIASTLLYQLRSNTYVYTSFEKEMAKSIRTRKTTRHTVLHGIDINYNKPSDSLRVFLILDAIAALKPVKEGVETA